MSMQKRLHIEFLIGECWLLGFATSHFICLQYGTLGLGMIRCFVVITAHATMQIIGGYYQRNTMIRCFLLLFCDYDDVIGGLWSAFP